MCVWGIVLLAVTGLWLLLAFVVPRIVVNLAGCETARVGCVIPAKGYPVAATEDIAVLKLPMYVKFGVATAERVENWLVYWRRLFGICIVRNGYRGMKIAIGRNHACVFRTKPISVPG
jgi:hypothetical protein